MKLIALLLIVSTALVSATSSSRSSTLAQAALSDIVIRRGSPILGTDEGCKKSSKTCDWMAKFSDNTKLVHMNLPGTHDTATWNYSDATQASLIRYTGPIPPAQNFRCQERSLLQMINDGIRVFDLRYAYNPGNDTIGFHHSAALLAPTTSLEDVLFGLYSWLDNHPTEALLISLNHEGGTGTPDDQKLQELLYKTLTSDLAQKYWVQTNGTLGTLGQARGKLTLLQRFTYNQLPNTSEFSKRMGIPLDAAHWTDNGRSIELTYNVAKDQVAFIEDLYALDAVLPLNLPSSAYIDAKFNATTEHIANATMQHPDQLYISFASAAFIANDQPITPMIYALGNGTDAPGMNQQLLPWLKERKGKRFGIIMLDFYDAVPGLVEAAIGL